MSNLVSYQYTEGVATATLDDGKANVMSFQMMADINQALDQAEAEAQVMVLVGRPGIFSAGFDLKILSNSPDQAKDMVRTGAELAHRIMTFPMPVITACTGHAYPMGAFLMLASDLRIGISGPYNMGLNEVAIGITVPLFAVELARYRLTPSYFNRTVVNAEMFSPEDAKAAGFLDQVVPEDELLVTAKDHAQRLFKLDMPSYRATKQKAKGKAAESIKHAIEAELLFAS